MKHYGPMHKKKIPAAVIALVLLGFTYSFSPGNAFFELYAPIAAQTKDPVIKLDAVVSTAAGNLYEPEAIVVAERGDKCVFIASKSKGLLPFPPTIAWMVKRDPVSGGWSRPVRLLSDGLCTSIAFANADKWLVASVDYFSLAALQNIFLLFTNPDALGDLHGFTHRLEIIDTRTKEKLMSFSPEDFGLEKNEILKHARVSPDARWLSLYTHSYAEQRGIYLYNFATGKTYHLALEDDKHPTWTPDGSKILFHHQRGGNAHTDENLDLEEARIGYYDLKFQGDDVVWKRILMDTMGGPGVYHKHPSVYAGTDLVFFHKKIRKIENGVEVLSKSMLHVRRVGVNTPIYKITDLRTADSIPMGAIKHVASATNLSVRSGLYLVGKEKEKDKHPKPEYKIYYLADKDVQKIASEIARVERNK